MCVRGGVLCALSYRPSKSAGRGSNPRPPACDRGCSTENRPASGPQPEDGVTVVVLTSVRLSTGDNRLSSARDLTLLRSCVCRPALFVALATELPAALRPGGTRTRDLRLLRREPDHFGPQQRTMSRSCRCDSVPESNRRTPDNRTAPAHDDRERKAGPPGVEPGPARLELAMLPVTPQACGSGRPASNGRLRSGAPVLCRLSYVRVKHARLDSNQRPLPSQSTALIH